MPSIVLESVHKTFTRDVLPFFGRKHDELHALRGISFCVEPGEVLALLGPNGSGKSTTLKLISTVLLPDHGRVLVGGADTRTRGHDVRRKVGFALASERSFFPRLTARENLEFFATLEDVRGAERKSCIDDALGVVGLHEHAQKEVMKFSSGMHQRLAIARAMIKKPQVLLLDEPTRSLDPAATSHLWGVVRDLSGSGITIVVATHNLSEAATVADRVAILQAGELVGLRRVNDSNTEALRRYYDAVTGQVEPIPWEEGVPA